MRKALIAAGIIITLAFAVFVWPTQWRYSNIGSSNVAIRENRFTGKVQRFYPSAGWVTVEYSPTQLAE